jgi:hypothetical protein
MGVFINTTSDAVGNWAERRNSAPYTDPVQKARGLPADQGMWKSQRRPVGGRCWRVSAASFLVLHSELDATTAN